MFHYFQKIKDDFPQTRNRGITLFISLQTLEGSLKREILKICSKNTKSRIKTEKHRNIHLRFTVSKPAVLFLLVVLQGHHGSSVKNILPGHWPHRQLCGAPPNIYPGHLKLIEISLVYKYNSSAPVHQQVTSTANKQKLAFAAPSNKHLIYRRFNTYKTFWIEFNEFEVRTTNGRFKFEPTI